MHNSDNYSELDNELHKVIKLHNNFQELLKKFELSFNIESPTVSQNENGGFFNNDLRYALRSSIDLLSLTKIEPSSEAQKHLNYLRTTMHILYNDLFDYIILFCSAYIDDLYKNYSPKIVNHNSRDEIMQLKEILKDCKIRISKSRKYREERLSIYEDLYTQKYPKILNIYDCLLLKSELILLEQEEYDARTKIEDNDLNKSKNYTLISITIAIISVITTIFIAIFK